MVVKADKVPFEEALTLTGFSKCNLVMFMLCASVIIGMAFEIFSVAYLVPASVCELDTTSAQQGLIAGVPLIGIIATSHFWGYLADTKGRRAVLCLSMTISFVAGALAAFSPNWIMLSVLKFISSAAVGGAYALSMTFLSECTPIAKRNTLILLTTSVFLSSTGIMAVLSIPILPLDFSYHVPYLDIQFNSWRVLDLIFCLPCAICALGFAWSFESPKFLLSVGKDEKALEVLRTIFKMNTGKDGDMYPVNSVVLDEKSGPTSTKGIWSSLIAQTVPMVKPPLLKNTLLLTLLFVIVYLCINPFMIWLPFMVDAFMSSVVRGDTNLTLCEMLRKSRDVRANATLVEEPTNCAMNEFAMIMVFGISCFLALLNSVIINWVGRKRLFLGLQFFAGIASLCINFSRIWLLSAALFVSYISGVLNFGVLSSFSVDIFPTYVKAMSVCVTLMVGRGSAALGINLLKSLLDVNCESAFYVFGGLTVAGGVIGFLLPSEEKILEQKKSAET